MSLQAATVEQLHSWLTGITDELCRRASQVQAPPVARAPWEQTAQPTYAPPQPAYVAPMAHVPPQSQGVPRMPPGTVLTTARTDPALAAKFMGVAPRAEGVPGLQGSGNGEGMINLGPSG